MTFESPYSKLTFFSSAPELLGDTDFWNAKWKTQYIINSLR